MSDFEVREIDVHDEVELRRWWETGRAAAADRLFDHYPPWELSREALPKERPDSAKSLVAAYDGGEMVGIAAMTAPLNENLHVAEAEVDVPVDGRRRGVGRALLAEAEAWAGRLGRTTILGQTFAPPGVSAPGEHFAIAHGDSRSPTARASRSSTSPSTPTGGPTCTPRWPRGSATTASSSGPTTPPTSWSAACRRP